jgi:hypothetical protein
MKTSWLERVYLTLLLVIFGGIVLHAPMSVWLGTVFPEYELLIKAWKEILLIVLLFAAGVIVRNRRLWVELSRDWLIRLVIFYIVLHLVTVGCLFQGVATAAAGMAIDLRYILYFLLVYIGLKALPQYRQLFIKVGIIGACIVVGFATAQLFLPPDFLKVIGYSTDTIVPYLTVDKNPDYIRVNSTLRGPNPLGAYAGMVLAFLAAALAKKKIDFRSKLVVYGVSILTACSIVALWISYSRSSLVAGIVAVLIVLALTVGRKMSRKRWIIACVVIFAIVGSLIIGRESSFVSNVILHENLEGGSSISSNEDHISSLQVGMERLVNQPFGVGVGSTGSASLFGEAPVIIENQYLFVAHEVGWLGLVLFCLLFGLILVRLWRRRQEWFALGALASGVGLALIGLLLPVWVDDTVAIVWWGLAAVALTTGGNDGKRPRK